MLAICGGGMRTGSIAAFQLMREIVEVTGTGHASDGSPLEEKGEKWAEDGRWIVAKQHGANPCIESYKHRVKVVVTYRNHLDVIVSLMHFKGVVFDRLPDEHRLTSNIDCFYSWVEMFNDTPEMLRDHVLPLRYEKTIVQDRDLAVLGIASFLGITMDRSRAIEIADKWSLEANKRRAREEHRQDSREFMSKRHIYRGYPGGWRQELTQEQVESLLSIKKISAWQEKMGYEPQ